jgi:hypothetical protein
LDRPLDIICIVIGMEGEAELATPDGVRDPRLRKMRRNGRNHRICRKTVPACIQRAEGNDM